MIAIHPNILEKDGRKEFAVLPSGEFLQLQEELQNYEDLKDLRDAKDKERNVAGMTLAQAKQTLLAAESADIYSTNG